MSLRKGAEIDLKGANSATFRCDFDPFTLLVGASDVVQSIRFRPPRRFCGDSVRAGRSRVSGQRLCDTTRRSVKRTKPSLVSPLNLKRVLQGADSANFQCCFEFNPRLAPLDVVQSSRFGQKLVQPSHTTEQRLCSPLQQSHTLAVH
jgi:hypothetical protein